MHNITTALRRGDWVGLALAWLEVAAAAIEQAERIYERSLHVRNDHYERVRDKLLERLRNEKHLLRTEHATLTALARERCLDESEAA